MWSQGHLLAPVVMIFLLLLEGFTATYAALVSTVSSSTRGSSAAGSGAPGRGVVLWMSVAGMAWVAWPRRDWSARWRAPGRRAAPQLAVAMARRARDGA